MRVLSTLIRLSIAVGMAGVALALTVAVAAPQVSQMLGAHDESYTPPNLDELASRSYVYAADGTLYAQWSGEENREEIPLEEIPEPVIRAILAIEDQDFEIHRGINLRATFRALLQNVNAGGISQGGSTITQQLCKNRVLTPEQTVERKFQEAACAWRLERDLSKDEILEEYLNTVYFGAGAYGVQAAAEVYFRSSAEDLDWGEAALLAALISNPIFRDPTLYPRTAEYQRGIVLNRLADLDYITEDEARRFADLPLPESINRPQLPPEEYFFEEVMLLLLNDPSFLGGSYGYRFDQLFKGGLHIETTFDPRAQAAAVQARDETVAAFAGDPRNFTLAMVSIEPFTGAVRAMVGGPDFRTSKFNLATQGVRQPGSAYKPVVLAAAFEQGMQPDDLVSGLGPCQFDDPGTPADPVYEANNFGGSAGFVGTLTELTVVSSNCGFLRLGQIVDMTEVVRMSRALGTTTPMLNVPSLPLGSVDLTPIEMATVYATFAGRGVRNTPYLIERILNSEGDVIYEHTPQPRRVLTETSACWVTDVLGQNVVRGTGVSAQVFDQPSAGKTGTTEFSEDAWYVGYTPYLSTAVWMGNPDARVRMNNVGGVGSVTGSSFPAQAWGRFNNLYHEPLPRVDFPDCDGYPRSGRLFSVDDENEILTNPCPGSAPLDIGATGSWDRCLTAADVGYYTCPYLSPFYDDEGNPVPIFCLVVAAPEPPPSEEAPPEEPAPAPPPGDQPPPPGTGQPQPQPQPPTGGEPQPPPGGGGPAPGAGPGGGGPPPGAGQGEG